MGIDIKIIVTLGAGGGLLMGRECREPSGVLEMFSLHLGVGCLYIEIDRYIYLYINSWSLTLKISAFDCM